MCADACTDRPVTQGTGKANFTKCYSLADRSKRKDRMTTGNNCPLDESFDMHRLSARDLRSCITEEALRVLAYGEGLESKYYLAAYPPPMQKYVIDSLIL